MRYLLQSSIGKRMLILDDSPERCCMVVGRSFGTGFRIDHPQVSGMHCTLTVVDGKLFVEDHSTNGTFIDGRKLRRDHPVRMHDGSVLTFVCDSVEECREELLTADGHVPGLYVLTPRQTRLSARSRSNSTRKRATEITAAAPSCAPARKRPRVALMQDGNGGSVLPELLCPITCEVMRDPVITADGHTYERRAIVRWLTQHATSPVTNLRLNNRELIPNLTVRAMCHRYMDSIDMEAASRAAPDPAELV